MRKNTGEITTKLDDRRERKITENTIGEDSLDDIPPENYMDGQMESTTNSTGKGWRGIGDDGRRKD